jgi:hypothetical protein
MNTTNINQQDFYSWTQQQISLLRSRRFNEIDLENLANLQTRSWILTIKEQRRRIVKRLQQSPSLKSKLNDVIAYAYDLARGDAADKIGLSESTFPIECSWTYTQIVDMEFWPKN